MKEYGHHMYMGHSIDVIAEWLFRMKMVIFMTGTKGTLYNVRPPMCVVQSGSA